MIDMPVFIRSRLPAPRQMARQLALWPLVMVFFFTVCGGAYGLEPLVSASGPGMALLLILVTPVIWAIPTVLMTAELSTAIPVEGGYYAWVKKGLGSFWAFQEGWWSWLSSFVDMAIYPVLFADYLSSLLGQQFGVKTVEQDPWVHWAVTLAVIWIFAALNVFGARAVGASSMLFGVLVLAPFIAMSVVGVAKLLGQQTPIWQPVAPPGMSLLGAFGAGLYIVMWNYQGWDSVSTADGEIRNPQRNILLALALGLPLVVLAYLLPTVAGLASGVDWTNWKEGSFPDIAAALGGPWLGTWLAIGGLFSAAALFSANLLASSRIPFVMADDAYLPKVITRLHPRYGTPWISIVLCALIYSIFTLQTFAGLVVIDVILYAAALLLEFGALIALRVKEPYMRRPFRVPGGMQGAVLAAVLPLAIVVLAMVSTIGEQGIQALYLSIAAIISGPVLYPVCRLLFKRGQPDVEVPVEHEHDQSPWLPVRLGRLVPVASPRWPEGR